MGNEDVVVCKKISSHPENKSDIAGIESINRGSEGMNLGRNKNTVAEEDEKRVDFVHVLPMEVIEEIFLYLAPKDLAACTAVSSSWREAVNSNKVWGHLCDKKGWKDNFESTFSHFYKAHKQFRQWTHSYDSFSPICQKRLLFNKHTCLQSNWRWGIYIVHKLLEANKKPHPYLQLFEPVSCDGRYIVTQEKVSKFGDSTLAVWSLEGQPYRVCNLYLPSKVQLVEAVAFDYETIAVAQAWVIIVYRLKNFTFEMVFEIRDLSNLEPKTKLPKDMKRMTPYLRVTQDFIICVPNHSHSTVDFIPIFFWDRVTGELKHRLCFDSMYYHISNAVWFKDSCYLSLTNKKKKSYQVVEFGVKSAAWEAFSQIVTVEVENIVVSEHYVLAVTKNSNPAFREYYSSRNESTHKELWLWDRATGSALKTFEAQGKGFQFIDDYLMYFDSSKVTVMNPKAPNMCTEFEVSSGVISSIRAACHPSVIVIIKNRFFEFPWYSCCFIEVWDWGLGTRLYTVTAEIGHGSQLWCDDKRIVVYHVANTSTGGGILVLGFW